MIYLYFFNYYFEFGHETHYDAAHNLILYFIKHDLINRSAAQIIKDISVIISYD